MSKNSIKEEPVQPEPEAEEKKSRSTRQARKLIKFMNVMGVFSREQVVNMMPFILFLSVLILFYIGNSYYTERIIRNIDKVKKELKENRAEFISVKSEMMFRSKQSEVAKAAEPLELREATVPPRKIIVSGMAVK